MMFMANLPIRSKLMILIMSVSLSVLLLASLAFISYDIRLAKQTMGQEISTLARLLGNRSTAALVFDDPTLARDNLQALEESPNLTMACVYRADGGEFASYRREASSPPCPPAPQTPEILTHLESQRLHVHGPIRLADEVVGYIYLEAELKSIDERLRKQAFAALLIAITAGLAAYLLSNLVQRLISNPLSHVAATATTIEQQRDYSLRAPEYGRDELGRLSHAFNAMLNTIEHQNLQLTQAKEHLENMVAERTHELEVTNQELESFAYSVSHDLRAPLRAINGFSQAIMETTEGKLAPESHNYLQRICKASTHMDELISALLTLSRTSSQEMHRSTTNISRIAQECLQELQDAHPERQVHTQVEADLFVHADPKLLHIVLHNLLANAWKFTRHCTDARIELGMQSADGMRVFYVRDNGAGFSMDYYDRLFGAFQRLHDQSEFEGTGIGLATVSRIIHRHGGEIWAESAPNQGATFRFTLGKGNSTRTNNRNTA